MKIIIEKLVYGGFGLGHLDDGKTVFVRKSVHGDEVDIKIVKNKKNYAEGIITKIIKPSRVRITPKCPYFDLCGGCDHQNIAYTDQLKFKGEIISEFAARYHLGANILLPIIAGSEAEFYYRNSIRFEFIKSAGGLKIARHNYIDDGKPVITEFCLLQSEFSNKILKKILDLYNHHKYQGDDLRQVKVREGKQTGEFMLEMITTGNNLPCKSELIELIKDNPEIKSFYQTIAPHKNLYQLRRKLLYGKPIIYEKIGQYTFQISPESFFQTNSLGVKKLYDVIKEFAKIESGDMILDLYCGTGSIGIYLSTIAKEIVGVESVINAVNDANDNARINKVSNIKFICQDVYQYINFDQRPNNRGLASASKFDVIIVDPPRAGLKKEVIPLIKERFSKRLIYVSCNPTTFFRDLKIMIKLGLIVKKIQPIDMFPQTHHIELVTEIVQQPNSTS